MMEAFLLGGVLAVLLITGAAVYIAAAGDSDQTDDLYEETQEAFDLDDVPDSDFNEDRN